MTGGDWDDTVPGKGNTRTRLVCLFAREPVHDSAETSREKSAGPGAGEKRRRSVDAPLSAASMATGCRCQPRLAWDQGEQSMVGRKRDEIIGCGMSKEPYLTLSFPSLIECGWAGDQDDPA